MRVLIVEDETAAYEYLAEALLKTAPATEIAGNTESVQQTLEWLRHNPMPDLIFMDIHLSDGPVFTLFDRIRIEVPIIFTTAYDQYAIEAFRVNGLDYLLKPVKPEELRRALEKFSHWMPDNMQAYLARLAGLNSRPTYGNKILVAWRDKLLPVPLESVSFFYTTGKSTCIVLKDGTRHSYPKTLEQVMATLDPSRFIRANKQFIVARDSIKEITVWFDNRLLVTLETDTPEPIYISKNRATHFKTWLVSP